MTAYDDYKIGAWTTPVANEADQPVRSAAEMKAIFDANSEQIKAKYNALADALSADKALYDAWKAGLENLLTPEQAASLAAAILVLQGQFAGLTPSEINAAKKSSGWASFTLLASGWSSGVYTITSANLSILENIIDSETTVEIKPGASITDAQLIALQSANIQENAISNHQFAIKARGVVPTVDIPIQINVRGDTY